MTTAQASASATIAAPPAAVYAVLADYRNHHPHILPTQYFRDFVAEEGDRGPAPFFVPPFTSLAAKAPTI